MLPDALMSQQLCCGPSPTTPHNTCLHRQRNSSGSRRVHAGSQSLRGVPTLPTTRCSCVLISANNSTKRSPTGAGSRKMRKSILQFAKRLWSSEDSTTRRVLCTNCKTDPVTQSTLCKKCCRRSTVCATCYSRILSLHHTRLDRFGSLQESTYMCPECNLSPANTAPTTPTLFEDNSVSYITPQAISGDVTKTLEPDPLRTFQDKRQLSSTSSPTRKPLNFTTSAPTTPVNPTSPINPTTPIKQAIPIKPTSPVKPTSPIKPISVGKPVNPTKPINTVKPMTLIKEKSFSSSDSEYQSCSENVDPDSPFTRTNPTPVTPLGEVKKSPSVPAKYSLNDKIVSPKILEDSSNKCVLVANKDCVVPRTVTLATKPTRTVALVTKPTPPVSMVTRSRLGNPNRPAMIRTRAIEECDELSNVMVKRTSMGDNVVLKPEIILPSRILGKAPDRKTSLKLIDSQTEKSEDVNEHTPIEFKRSYSESSKDRLSSVKNEVARSRHGSIPDARNLRKQDNSGNPTDTPAKRTVRIAEDANIEFEHSRPSSLELEHVTVGEVTPTVYVKDKNDVIDESIQKSESVLKRSLSVSNSRLQRKLSRKLLSKDKINVSQSEEATAPHFLRRNRSSSSVDKTSPKSSPPPDLMLMTNAGIALEDIQAFGLLYIQRLENRMRNIDALKELEKQHNISCRERLKTALDAHEQLSAGLDDVKRQLKECMEKYRFISETFV